jgi:hypothetical protein
MRDQLNAARNVRQFGRAFYDRFWPETEGNHMQYLVMKQIAVEADSPEEAIAKSKGLPSISVSAQPRPAVATQPPAPAATPAAPKK